MDALQRHRYPDAAQTFETLIEKHPGERALLERARVYLDLCQRELRKRPAEPRTLEERVIGATAALNNGDEARAEALAKAVLREDPKHDLAIYQLAVVETRRGNAAQAIEYLRDVIALSAEASAQARFDPDFEPLRSNPTFRELTDSSAAPANGSGKRIRRGRER